MHTLKKRELPSNILRYVLLLLGGAVSIMPMIYMISTSLKPNGALYEFPPKFFPALDTITLENYVYIFSQEKFYINFLNSVIVAVLTVVIAAFVSSALAFCLARFRFGNAADFEHDFLILDDCNPVFRSALAGAHTDAESLLRNRLVGEDLDPDLATTLGVTGHGDTGSLDLIALDPAGLQSHQAKLTVGNGVATSGFTSHTAPLHTAELDSLRH